MKKLIFAILVISGAFSSVSQELNSYKYVIVADEFDFLKEPNQHQLNELTKFLFERNGMESFIEGERLPEDLLQNRCKALNADVESNSGLFSTKLTVVLKDCNNIEVFRSEEGRSKIKSYKEAYHEALRDAFTSIEAEGYAYTAAKVVGNQSDLAENTPTKVEGIDQTERERNMDESPVAATPRTEAEVIKKSANDKEWMFIKGNTHYFLEESDMGFDFYQKGMAEPFAALVKSSSGSNYIYSSINKKGMANFDQTGNLVVEILNTGDNTLETTIYERQ